MCIMLNMERGSSAVECRTRKQVSPGSNPLFATFSKIGHFRSLYWRPSWLSCTNEYLAIDSGGNVSDLVLARNCCMARMLHGEAELVTEWTGLPGRAKSVKRFQRSNGLDTALYQNYLLFWCSALFSPSHLIHWHRPVHSNTHFTFQGSCSDYVQSVHSLISTTAYTQVLIVRAERTHSVQLSMPWDKLSWYGCA